VGTYLGILHYHGNMVALLDLLPILRLKPVHVFRVRLARLDPAFDTAA
jgi:hypothetical protein